MGNGIGSPAIQWARASRYAARNSRLRRIPPGALDVRLTLNGDAWPDGSTALARAGTFRATSRRDPLSTWTFDLPATFGNVIIDDLHRFLNAGRLS